MSKECTISHHKKKLVVIEERGRKLTFRNPEGNYYDEIIVDGCLITEGRRCDRLINAKGKASVLIELKGNKINDACDQLIETAKHPRIKDVIMEKVGFVIVCSRVPCFDSAIAKAQSYLAKQYKAKLHVFCDRREVHINQIVKID